MSKAFNSSSKDIHICTNTKPEANLGLVFKFRHDLSFRPYIEDFRMRVTQLRHKYLMMCGVSCICCILLIILTVFKSFSCSERGKDRDIDKSSTLLPTVLVIWKYKRTTVEISKVGNKPTCFRRHCDWIHAGNYLHTLRIYRVFFIAKLMLPASLKQQMYGAGIRQWVYIHI